MLIKEKPIPSFVGIGFFYPKEAFQLNRRGENKRFTWYIKKELRPAWQIVNSRKRSHEK